MTYESQKRKNFTTALIDQKLTGKGTNADAYRKAGYKAKNRQQAKANASTLKKHPEVKEGLKQFKDILLKEAPPSMVAKKIGKNIKKGDGRLSDSAIDKWLKLFDQYPAGRLNLKHQDSDQNAFLKQIKDITE